MMSDTAGEKGDYPVDIRSRILRRWKLHLQLEPVDGGLSGGKIIGFGVQLDDHQHSNIDVLDVLFYTSLSYYLRRRSTIEG